MKRIHFFNLTSSLHLVISTFFFQAKKVSAVDENFTICSQPTNCGSLTIKFPFFIEQRERRCGYPGFHISCRNNNTILSLPDGNYIIRDIDYQNQSFQVSKAVNLDRDAFCSHSIRNISLPEDRFKLPKNQSEMILLFDCNSTLQLIPELSDYKVDCGIENDRNTTLAVLSNDPMLNLALKYCTKRVSAPVAFSDGEGDVEDVVNRGFVLNWIASNCSVCERTGGKCGFDYKTYHFKCFCPDRPHAARCHPEKKNTLWLKLGLGNLSFVLLKLSTMLPVKQEKNNYFTYHNFECHFCGIHCRSQVRIKEKSCRIGCPALIIMLISIYVLWGRYKQKYAPSIFLKGSSHLASKSDLENSSTVCFQLPIFSYNELVEATNNFDDKKELGDGGFGTVYYGKLRDGREVAVKRLYQHNYRRLEQFMNEVEILTQLRHKNLVSLYGCTSRRSQELLLVYEFIANGTVADHLHGDLVQSSSLTWPVRLSIGIETASALAYLHASGIIHRDVKTNNILLDSNFSVKVADFGLSRLFPADATHISTAPQGTPGYVDPEYHQCYQVTEKSDVYSFGVVLIELVTSLPAVDISRHRHEINLANLAISKIEKHAFDELIDPNLGYNLDPEVTRMTTSVAELAFRCLHHGKEMRPSMEEVLEELQRIQREDCWLGSLEEEEHTNSEVPKCVLPSPSPVKGDQIVLLKNTRMPSSPVSVTHKWVSRSTTPNASG